MSGRQEGRNYFEFILIHAGPKSLFKIGSCKSARESVKGWCHRDVWVPVSRRCSVTQSCLALWGPVDCSTPGFPVLQCLLGFARTPVHRVGDATNHLFLCCPLLLLPSVFPSIRVFLNESVLSNESVLHSRWSKYWSFSFSICPSRIFRVDFL